MQLSVCDRCSQQAASSGFTAYSRKQGINVASQFVEAFYERGSAESSSKPNNPQSWSYFEGHFGAIMLFSCFQAKQSLATLTKDVPKRHSVAMPTEPVVNGSQEWVMQADLPLTAAIRQSQQTLYHGHTTDRQGR